MMIKSHLKHMLIGGAAILAVLLVVGVDLRQAFQWAVIAACPLMMVVMMGRGHGGHGDPGPGATPEDHGTHRSDVVPPQHTPDTLDAHKDIRR